MRAFEHEACIQPMFRFQPSLLQFLSISWPFISLLRTSEEQNYFYTSFALAHKSTDRPGISTQESEWRGVICDSIKLARTGNKGSFSTGLISREQALQSHWTLPWALGYALTFSRLSLRQHSGRRTAVVMTLPYDCVGHSTFKIC